MSLGIKRELPVQHIRSWGNWVVGLNQSGRMVLLDRARFELASVAGGGLLLLPLCSLTPPAHANRFRQGLREA